MTHRRLVRRALIGSFVLLAACSGPAPSEGPETTDPTIAEAPEGVSGWIDQVDRARDVSDQVDERNSHLEDQLP